MPIRWEPFDEALDLAAALVGQERGLTEPRAGAWTPPVDVFETEGAFFIKAEVPGVPPEKIKVEVHGRRLTIAGERDRGSSSRKYHNLERIAGPFARNFSLPTGLATDQIEASYRNGVLEIILPKKSDPPGRQIPVKSA